MVVPREQNSNIGKYVLIGRCECDNTLRFPFYWAEEIKQKALNLGFQVIDLQRENFIESKFTRMVIEKNPSFIFLNGHGDEMSAFGYQEIPVITLNKNDYLLIDKIVHIISCKTGLWLGQFAVDKGCKGYIGYQGLFSIKNVHPDPNKDEYSKMFKEVVNETSLMLLNNRGVINAFNKSQQIYDKNIKLCATLYFDLSLSDSQRDFIQGVKTALESNKNNQIFHI